MDDIENRYGGWYDPDLSPAGIEGARQTGEKLKRIKTEAKLILSSPLKRALQTANIIGDALKIPVEKSVYLKERNTYGLLSGENKKEARQKYPELTAAYEKGKEVLGYENYGFFLKRVRELIKKITNLKKETLVCVAHGKLLGALFKDILGIEVKKFHDNCIAEIDIDSQGNLTLVNTDGIVFT